MASGRLVSGARGHPIFFRHVLFTSHSHLPFRRPSVQVLRRVCCCQVLARSCVRGAAAVARCSCLLFAKKLKAKKKKEEAARERGGRVRDGDDAIMEEQVSCPSAVPRQLHR